MSLEQRPTHISKLTEELFNYMSKSPEELFNHRI